MPSKPSVLDHTTATLSVPSPCLSLYVCSNMLPEDVEKGLHFFVHICPIWSCTLAWIAGSIQNLCISLDPKMCLGMFTTVIDLFWVTDPDAISLRAFPIFLQVYKESLIPLVDLPLKRKKWKIALGLSKHILGVKPQQLSQFNCCNFPLFSLYIGAFVICSKP